MKGGSPHSRDHQVESEPFSNRAASPGSGIRSQRRSSQSQSGTSALGAQSTSGDMLADEIEEEEEDDLSSAVRHRSEREQHARRQLEEEERAQQEEERARRAQEQLAARRRAAQAMVAELRRKKSEKKASALGGVGKGRESDDELDGGPIDADEELVVTDVDAVGLSLVSQHCAGSSAHLARHSLAGSCPVPEAASAQDEAALPDSRRSSGEDGTPPFVSRRGRRGIHPGTDKQVPPSVPARRCRVLVRAVQARHRRRSR